MTEAPELHVLPHAGAGSSTRGRRIGSDSLAEAAVSIADLPGAWIAADDARRNALSRMLFVQVRIKDGWVAAVEPQPRFAPFFSSDCQVLSLAGGSDGDRSRTYVMFCMAPWSSLSRLFLA